MPLAQLSIHDARIAWSTIAEPGDHEVGPFIAAHGDDPLHALHTLTLLPEAVRENVAETFGAALERWRPRYSEQLIDRTLREVRRLGLSVLTPEEYPEVWLTTFRGLEVDPIVLFVQGDVGVLAPFERRIAIVGARAATGYGEQVTSELASEAARHDVITVSGAAYGVDAAAHRATMANGGKTVAILAGGLDRYYPAGNQALIRQVIQRGGAVVAEVPPITSPTRSRFLERNRLIAAFGEGMVVTEAGFRSGSLAAADRALRLRRPVGAVPGSIFSIQSAGCHRLIDESGARLIRGWGDVEAMLTAAIL